MYVGTLSFDLLLGDVRSLKEKRSVVRPIVAELQRKFAVSVAETGDQDLHRRAEIGLAVVSGDTGHLTDVLDRCERWSPAGPRWSCCRYDGGSTATTTDRPTTRHQRTRQKQKKRDGPVADNARAQEAGGPHPRVWWPRSCSGGIKDPRLGLT